MNILRVLLYILTGTAAAFILLSNRFPALAGPPLGLILLAAVPVLAVYMGLKHRKK